MARKTAFKKRDETPSEEKIITIVILITLLSIILFMINFVIEYCRTKHSNDTTLTPTLILPPILVLIFAILSSGVGEIF